MVNVFRLARFTVALLASLGKTFLFSPLWLTQAFMRQKVASGPNTLQILLDNTSRNMLAYMAWLGVQPDPHTRKPSQFRDWLLCREFTWVEPAPRNSFKDEKLPVKLEEKEWFKKIGALWFLNSKEKGGKGNPSKLGKPRRSPCLLYFHGGAYITLEAGDVFVGLSACRMLAKYAEVDILSVNYRHAPGSKFPSQVFEAFSAYRHLRSLGYDQIFLGGDSAGANLALALWRYLATIDGDTSAIVGMLLDSPWLDMDNTRRIGFQQNLPTCVITEQFVVPGAQAYQNKGLPGIRSPWCSPVKWAHETNRKDILGKLPPLYVIDGGAGTIIEKTLLEEGKEFVAAAKSCGVDAKHIVVEGYPHDFMALPYYATTTQRTFKEAKGWFYGLHKTS